jgi:hypothetical protein
MYYVEDDVLVGLPSGQVITVNRHEAHVLLNLGLIDWNPELNEFTFDDRVYKKIIEFLYEIREGDFVKIKSRSGRYQKAKVIEIVGSYDGSDIMGRNFNRVFDIGTTVYVVKFTNGQIGMYEKDQIKKIRDVNDEII